MVVLGVQVEEQEARRWLCQLKEEWSLCPSDFATAITKLLKGWRDHSKEVMAEYPFYVEDYSNDLTLREIIQRVVNVSSPDLAAAILRSLDSVDATFRENTIESDHPALIGFKKNGMWWYDRIPKRIRETDF